MFTGVRQELVDQFRVVLVVHIRRTLAQQRKCTYISRVQAELSFWQVHSQLQTAQPRVRNRLACVLVLRVSRDAFLKLGHSENSVTGYDANFMRRDAYNAACTRLRTCSFCKMFVT